MEELQTVFLVPDLHCPTCVSHIESGLAELDPKPQSVTCSLVSHAVTVRHLASLEATTISSALDSAGYEVDSILRNGTLIDLPASTTPKSSGLLAQISPKSNRSNDSERKERHRIHLQHCELCRKGSLQSPSSISSLAIHPLKSVEVEAAFPELSEAHLSVNGMTCSSCVANVTQALKSKPWVQSANVNLLTNSAIAVVEGKDRSDQLVELIEDLGYEATVDRMNEIQGLKEKKPVEQLWRASLSIEGMTCSSCVENITHALELIPWTQKVIVNLLNANATVDFQDRKHIPDILATVDDAGYTATLSDLMDLSKITSDGNTRSVQIQVNGIFCEHCPTRIISALEAMHASVKLEKAPSLTDPVLKVTYVPNPPDFTVRHILRKIESIDPGFEPTIYKPPSLEERARVMHRRERWQVLYRVILSLTAAIPSFTIGIVFMSLVSSNNHTRKYLMEPWANVPRAQWALFVTSTPVYLLAADLFHRRALKEVYVLWRPRSSTPILRRFYRFGSMNLLMSLGTTIAYLSSVVQLILVSQQKSSVHGQTGSFYFDSVVFLTLFLLLGRFLEAWSKAKTGDAVAMLGKLRPSEAILVEPKKDEEGVHKVQVDTLEVGDIVKVPHGSSPPIDGIVLNGQGRFDESSLTGESQLIAKAVGDDVFSGTINQGNAILVRATKLAGSSMLDQIIQVVREGQARRAPIERIADKITSYFVPLITLTAIITWIIWLVLGESGALPADWLDIETGGWPFWSLQFAIAVFIIACPCGIGLAAPTALFVGSGLAAKNGILVKGGGEAFQESSQLDIMVFDKTGTLTEGGEPSITDHEYLETPTPIEKHSLKTMVKVLEESSSHPLAKAITAFLKDGNGDVRSKSIEEITGRGMKGTFTNTHPGKLFTVLVGNERLLHEHNVSVEKSVAQLLDTWKTEAKSVILVAVRVQEGENLSANDWIVPLIMAASDPMRPESATVVNDLQKRGIAVWMISGDNTTTANAIGKAIGIPTSNIIAGVLPEQKAKEIQYLQKSQTKMPKRMFSRRKQETDIRATVAMVGDGVNDSPALTVADVGIAIGSGSDVAISSADFVLISPHLSAIPLLLELSRKVFTRIKFNFGWALIYNLIALPIAAGVLYPVKSGGNHIRLDPVWASLAMALSSISVVTSSLALKTSIPYAGFEKLRTR